MAWVVQFNRGVWLPQIGWWLDAQLGAPRSFVSHAHSDHIARHQSVLCTPATARFMQARLGGKRAHTLLGFDQPHALELGCEVRLQPAGHILGSAMFHATTEHGTLLYTGDFKLRPGLAAERCATPRADVLIMETTFGKPRYVMPPSAEVAAQIVAFCQQALAEKITPVLHAYSLGKTQEVLRIVGDAGLPVQLHPQSFRMTQLYEQCGLEFAPHAEFHAVTHPGHVVISPPQADFLHLIHPRRTAVVTGWAVDSSAKYRYGCDAAFPLSDHADFPDLLAFVDLVQPKIVYTLHGFAREFAATLRARGVEAWAIGQQNQMELSL
ncbi:MAG: MBL fold metallo-hydrolase [Opitutae bacterium]|nr:MBL fold metallo-hydrolase [Opitutae bacterium]